MTEDVPPARQCTMCDREAVDPTRSGALCEAHLDALDDDDETAEPEGGFRDANPGGEPSETDENGDTDGDAPRATEPTPGAWSDADFSTTTADTYPPTLLEREQWMGRQEKLPFAPWGDADPDDADPDDSPRYEWGRTENYLDGDDVALAEDDPRLDGRVFLQQDADPFAFVDGDDVRCPETGDVHPAFTALLEHLGLTYADVSTSGSGVHAPYRAPDGLPINGKGQADYQLDTEPWGANDDPPTVEIYANKHVNVTTGDHVDGTPREVREWNADILRTILQANGYEDQEPVDHDTDRDRPDLDDYDADATDRDDTAGDVRDVLKAVDRLEPRDLPLRTRRSGTDATGWTTWDPSYRTSESGESLHYNGEGAFYDHKKGETFGVLSLFAAEEGIIPNPWNRLTGSEWWQAVDVAREVGASIPEYDPERDPDTEPTAVLPTDDSLMTPVTGWDWRHVGARANRDVDPVQEARDRTTAEIADALESSDRALVEALPTTGKTYGTLKATAKTGVPVTMLVGRGNVEQYDQIKTWCDELDLDCYTLPSFLRDCDTANGEHGEEWGDTVRDWYERGATPQEIHKYAEHVLGRPLPCQAHEGQRCGHTSRWAFDPDDYDVLLGHYTHAYNQSEKVTVGRAVIFDEFPGDTFERSLGGATLKGAVTHYLRSTDAVPFDDYTELLEHRDDEARRADALAHLMNEDLDPDVMAVFENSAAHAAAPLAVFTILAAADNDLGNGLETAPFPDDDPRVGVFDRAGVFSYQDERADLRMLDPPPLDYASAVIALDGTPTLDMWELALDTRLNKRRVLSDSERRDYIRDALNLNVVRTTEHVKPYNSPDHVDVRGDAALLDAVREQHGEKPGLITTRTALDEYASADVLDYDPEDGTVTEGAVERVKWRGDVLGSNEFDGKRLGVVIGSNHFGDGYIKKWGAYAGEAVTREASDDDEPAKGDNLSYGEFGDKVHTHMSEHDTLQAVMRFGRDGNGGVVYCHTNTLPRWPPLAGEGRIVDTRSDGERQVLTATEDLDAWRTPEIAAHPDVDVTERQVFNILNDLTDRGVLTREWDGRGYTWHDDGLHEVNEHGDVDLGEPVDLDDVDDEQVAETARNTIYTWKFRNTTADPPDSSVPGSENGGDTALATGDGGDRPPDPGD